MGVTFIISVLVCTVIALLSTLQTTTNFLQVGSPNVLTTRTSLHEYYDVVNKSRRTKQDSISFREYSMFISTYELIDCDTHCERSPNLFTIANKQDPPEKIA